MEDSIKKYLIVGLVTVIIGRIVMELIFWFKTRIQKDKVDRQHIDDPKQAVYVYLNLFIIGVILHYSIENLLFRENKKYDSFSNWICKIICVKDKCKAICETDM
jgi:hypothetical protein